eukprot:COSAG03_NODE_8740_length_775_cov_0.607988_1_plen_32_part_10
METHCAVTALVSVIVDKGSRAIVLNVDSTEAR